MTRRALTLLGTVLFIGIAACGDIVPDTPSDDTQSVAPAETQPAVKALPDVAPAGDAATPTPGVREEEPDTPVPDECRI
jgi:hypothetical protein